MSTFKIHLLVTSLLVACVAAAEVPAPVFLRAKDGPVIASLQKAPSPNKPYIAQLFAPGKMPLPLLDDSPPDHFHHHGLMFAIGVDDTDFWTEKRIKNAGREDVVSCTIAPAGDGFQQRLRWLAADGVALLDESRAVRVRSTGEGKLAVHWLDWASTITPAAGRDKVRLTGHHYFGLGMRFLPAWSNRGEFIWQDATVQTQVRGDEKLTPGDWCAARCVIDGQPVTVLMVSHPANARAGSWFTMSKPFCYLSATLHLDKEPAFLAEGEAWTLRYGLAVLSTPADHARLNDLAAVWRASTSVAADQKSNSAKP